jgi:hypothetical protein
MASRKQGSPERSRKSVRSTVAFARARKDGDAPDGETPADRDDDDGETVDVPPAPKDAAPPTGDGDAPAKPEPKAEAKAEPKPEPKARPAPAPAPPAPPEPASAVHAISTPAIEVLADPASITPGDPDAAEPPPGLVPPGDSRSFRRGAGPTQEFALVYRSKSFLVTRVGVVGRRGQWRVVEYPNQGSASHAYAQECSRLVTEGYSDFRG